MNPSNRSLRFSFICALALFAASAVFAQDANPPAEKSSTHRAATLELLKAMMVEEVSDKMVESMIDMQVQQAPMIAPYAADVRTFMMKYLSYEAIKEDYIRVYMETFTEAETKELTAFYRTPTGKKAALMLPVVSEKLALVGMKKMEAHMPELQQLIMKRVMDSQGK